MSHPSTVLALFQRILSPSSEASPKKRKRSNAGAALSSQTAASSSTDEVDKHGNTTSEQDDDACSSTEDRERSISEFLALADTSPKNRLKNGPGRLSTIEESEEPVHVSSNKAIEGQDMVDVDLGEVGLDVPGGAIYTSTHSQDGMVVDQDTWTWHNERKTQPST